MPPIAKLTPDQTLFHFISGYTSKISGTEVGLGIEPEITFSMCFGAPFMVHPPSRYADLLKRKILKYNPNCWLVNTGWIGGPYGVGKRLSIGYTRTLLKAASPGRCSRRTHTPTQCSDLKRPGTAKGSRRRCSIPPGPGQAETHI